MLDASLRMPQCTDDAQHLEALYRINQRRHWFGVQQFMFNQMLLSRGLRVWWMSTTKPPATPTLLERDLDSQKLYDHQYSSVIDNLLKNNQAKSAFRVLLNSHLNSVVLDAHSYYNIFLGLRENKYDITYTEVLYRLFRQHFPPMPMMLTVMKTLLKAPGSEHIVEHDLTYYQANRKKQPNKDDVQGPQKQEEQETAKMQIKHLEEEEDDDLGLKTTNENNQNRSRDKKKRTKKPEESEKTKAYSEKGENVSAESIPLKDFKIEFEEGKPFTWNQKLTQELNKIISPFSQYSFNIHDVNIQFQGFNDNGQMDSQELDSDSEYVSEEQDREYTLMDVLAGVKNIRVGKIEIIKNKTDQ